MIIYLTIPGKPIAKKRPRFFRRGNFVGTYNDQQTEEGRWLWEAKHQLHEQGLFTGPLKLIEGPVILKVSFIMPIPKNTPKRDMKKLEDGQAMWHDKRPDLDNLIKFVKDCLNKFLWEDDSQVCHIVAMKVYGLEAATQVEIEEI